MKNLKIILTTLVLLIVGIILISFLYQKVHPFGSINPTNDFSQIKDRAERVITELMGGIEDGDLNANLKENQNLMKELQSTYGLSESNGFIQNNIPVFFWEVKWLKKNTELLEGESVEEGQAVKSIFDEIVINLDLQGKVLGIKTQLSDTINITDPGKPESFSKVFEFLHSYTPYSHFTIDTSTISSQDTSEVNNILRNHTGTLFLIKNDVIRSKNQTKYKYELKTYNSLIEKMEIIDVSTVGSIFYGYQSDYILKEEEKNSTEEVLSIILPVSIYIVLLVMGIIFAFKRFRAYELGFKLAGIIGLFGALSLALDIILDMGISFPLEQIISIILGPLFYGLLLILVWSVSETLGRETWKEKFYSLDLIINGHLTHSLIWKNVLRGLAWGIFSVGIWIGVIHIIDLLSPIWLSKVAANSSFIDTESPLIFVVNQAIHPSLFKFALFILFFTPILKWKIRSPVLLVLVGGVVWGLAHKGFVNPLLWGVVPEIIIGFFFIWSVIKYDLIASFITVITHFIWRIASSYFFMGGDLYFMDGFLLLILFVIIMALGVIFLYTKDNVNDLDSISPAYVKFISERQRLRRELEIARNVQMSFLPRKNPEIKGLQIVSKCIPAYEVGGDYYDFVEMKDSRLGVVIGDVSGKGTMASFHMTLAKGALKALAPSFNSPAFLLSQMNNVFYENVERGKFISMVYAIFDLNLRKVTFARAGHNPIICLNKSEAKTIKYLPRGLALGLEKGELFSKHIEENCVNFETGDIFVFYTDGFSEARNKKHEEIGEEKLLKIIESHSSQPLPKMLENILRDIRQFTGKVQQHDDMTIVIVKIE